MNASEIIHRAANLIEERGWVKSVFESDKGYCMAGAINRCSIPKEFSFDQLNQAYEKIESFITNDYPQLHNSNVIYWNDFVCESKEQAIQLLRKAAHD